MLFRSEFIYSKIGLSGKILDRATLSAPKDRPRLARAQDGTVAVVGGIPFDPKATPPPGLIPKLSERPVALPTPEPAPTSTPKGKAKGKTTPSPTSTIPDTAKPSATPAPVKID